jgi:uncharacterized protein (DUF983 family)
MISRGESILKMLCPACRKGKVFTGLFRMNERCPVCRTQFEREPGYFLASMYLNYLFGGLLMIGSLLLLMGLTPMSFKWDLICSVTLLWLSSPLIFRYARIIFMNFDRETFPDVKD